MRRIARRRFRSLVEPLEVRTLPTTFIALIDTGVNPDPINSAYLDMADAYNAVDGSNNVADTDPYHHGTEMADYIAKEIQSVSAIMNINPSVEILPIKDWDTNAGGITWNALIFGIEHAIGKGASVMNFSVEGYTMPTGTSYPYNGVTFTQAVTDAESVNSIAVIAAGNNGDQYSNGIQEGNQNIDIETPYPVYPAVTAHDAPTLPNAIVATASDSSGNLSAIANYGVNHVDLAAPNTYYTSDAAADVSAIVGVVSALNPGSTYTQIRNIITQNTQSAAGLAGKTITGGMINAYNSMLAGFPNRVRPTIDVTPRRPTNQAATGNPQRSTFAQNSSHRPGV